MKNNLFSPKGINQDDFNSTAVFVKSDFWGYYYDLILFILVLIADICDSNRGRDSVDSRFS